MTGFMFAIPDERMTGAYLLILVPKIKGASPT